MNYPTQKKQNMAKKKKHFTYKIELPGLLSDLDALNIASLRALSVAKDMMATAYEDYSGGTKLEVAYPSIYQ